MKRVSVLLSLVLAVVGLASLMGCGDDALQKDFADFKWNKLEITQEKTALPDEYVG